MNGAAGREGNSFRLSLWLLEQSADANGEDEKKNHGDEGCGRLN